MIAPKTSTVNEDRAITPDLIAFAAIATVVVVVGAPDLFSFWAVSPTYRHGAFAPVLAVILVLPVLRHSAQKTKADVKTVNFRALIAVAGCGAAWFVGDRNDIQFLAHAGLIGVLMASFMRATSTHYPHNLLPGSFILFALPTGESLRPILADWAAWGTYSALKIVGTPVSLSGNLIRTEWGAFQITTACSGLSLISASIMFASFISYLAYRHLRSCIIMIAAAALFAILANIIRIMMVILLSRDGDRAVVLAADHDDIGLGVLAMLFFALIIAARATGKTQAETPNRDQAIGFAS